MSHYLTDEQIKEWNKKYKGLLNSINIGFMLFDPMYTCYSVNDAFLEMVGAKPEEYLSVNMKSLFSPEEFQRLYNLIEPLEIGLKKQKSIDEKKYYLFEWFWYHHQTGEKIPMLCTGAINLNKEGEHETTYITCTDLREQKHMQREVRKEKNKLKAILSGIGDCITIFDKKGDPIFANKQGEKILGKQKRPLLDLKPGASDEINLTIKNEQRRYSGKIEGLQDDEGQIFAYAEILKDVTDKSKLLAKEKEISIMKEEMRQTKAHSEIIGISRVMRNLFDLITRCAKVESSVLITGETGTGKEMVARAIHKLSSRNDMPFIAVNCGALPEALLESELFGHVKGAFTGAISKHKGLFMEADGGTLFLDEIGDLPQALQIKLLRVLQDQKIRPVGGSQNISVDVKLITATHRNLHRLIKNKEYRRDLYYRLAVIPLELPPLRERTEDILPLAEHFFKKYKQKRRSIKTMDHETQSILLDYTWPGNVRELENCIEHALAMSKKQVIKPDNLPVHVIRPEKQRDDSSGLQPFPTKNQSEMRSPDIVSMGGIKQKALKPWELDEKTEIEQALIQHKGNRTQTAKAMGISRGTLWRKIGLFQIEF